MRVAETNNYKAARRSSVLIVNDIGGRLKTEVKGFYGEYITGTIP